MASRMDQNAAIIGKLTLNGFSATCNNNNYHNNLLQTGFLGVY